MDNIKAHPDGYRTLKFGIEPLCGHGVHALKGAIPSQTQTAMEVEVIRKGFENIREAMGGDMDLIVHCHNE